jgi:hypothetical protein
VLPKLVAATVALPLLLGLGACDEPSDDLLRKSYTVDELSTQVCARTNACVRFKDRTVFIDKGYVFTYDPSWTKLYRRQAHAREIVSFEGHPVIRTDDGQVRAYVPNDGGNYWFTVGENSVQIARACDDLLSLGSAVGELYRVDGRPGARGLHVTRTYMMAKIGSVPNYHLYIDDRPVRLLGTGRTGIETLAPDGVGVDLVRADGSKEPYCTPATQR